MTKHAGNHYSELLIATKITLFAASDDIKIALAYNTGIIWHSQGAGRLNIAATPSQKLYRLHTLGLLTRLEMEVINAQLSAERITLYAQY